MSSKSAVKLVSGEGASQLYRWVTLLTGSKNALKGAGFFLGGFLLSVLGFQTSVLILGGLVLAGMLGAAIFMRGSLGTGSGKAKFSRIFSANRSVNLLAAARVFLFGARDVWFVVALPVFLSSAAGWEFWQTGGFMAAWVIGYGAVQALAPAIVRRRKGGAREPDGRTAAALAAVLAVIPAAIAIALSRVTAPTVAVTAGLVVFGLVFALNSAVHSFLILASADSDRVAMNVGFYYMANACGRLAGTVLSGWLYQSGLRYGPVDGLSWSLWASAGMAAAAALISTALPSATPEPAAPPRAGRGTAAP
jgi:hypothetical protein